MNNKFQVSTTDYFCTRKIIILSFNTKNRLTYSFQFELQIEDAMLMFDKQTNRHRGEWKKNFLLRGAKGAMDRSIDRPTDRPASNNPIPARLVNCCLITGDR